MVLQGQRSLVSIDSERHGMGDSALSLLPVRLLHPGELVRYSLPEGEDSLVREDFDREVRLMTLVLTQIISVCYFDGEQFSLV